MKIRGFLLRFIYAAIDTVRPMLGPRGVCIYHPFTCRKYMKITLKQKPFYIAIPLICFRLLSCNPITALFFRIRSSYRINSSNSDSR